MDDVAAAHYFAGVIGMALLRNWYVDGSVNAQRMADLADVIARLDELPHSLQLNPQERDLLAAYREWAATYDGANPLIAGEAPVVQPILERLCGPGVRALDAACGTGRHAARLVELGCATTGIDRSEAMLDVARAKIAGAQFVVGDIEALPFADGHFDVVIVSLALCHLADPIPAIVELGRVLRAGGTLVISDPHAVSELIGGQAFYGGIAADRPMTWVRNHYHAASTWLRAFRQASLAVEECHEVSFPEGQLAASPASRFYPDAARAVIDGLPSLWVWVVTRAGGAA